jgi:hypothetical protein
VCQATYQLKNGTCSLIPLSCPSRTYYNSQQYICAPVSVLCGNYSSVNGTCTSCANSAYKVVSGVCINYVNNCTPTQYIVNGTCININPFCQTFVKIGGVCTSCIFGYQLESNNSCFVITCPSGYVPNDYGKCIQVSPLCATYDSKGNCLTCVAGSTVQNGACLQTIGPNPCPAGQYLGFDNNCSGNNATC